MKPWQLNKRVDSLSENLADQPETQTRIDINCFSEPERKLIERIQEMIEKYAPGSPPEDVIEKNADLWYKGLEIFAKRVTELFVDVMPASICSDELEEWYFRLYFFNFQCDWMETVKQLRDMPKERYDALLAERREMGLLDGVFWIHRNQVETKEKQKVAEEHKK